MKKTAFYFASMAVLAIGCQAEMEPDNPLGGEVSEVTFTAVTESSADVKTSLNPSADNEKIYNIHWSASDKVLVSDGINSAEYTASPSEETPTYAGLYTTATTTPADDAEKYYAVFPSLEGVAAGPEGYTVVVPAEQTWVQGEFDMPMVGLGDAEHHIAFMNAASILKITPNNLCDSYDGVRVAKIEVSASSGNIAGTMSVTYDGSADPEVSEVTGGSNTITLDCGEDGAPFSETFYIALVPGSYETLTITITSNGGGSQTFTLNTPEGKAYERSEYASVGVKISNLAIYETANCYLIKKAGTYKFPVNVKGNGNAVVKNNVHVKANSNKYDPAQTTEVTVFDASINVSDIKGISKMVISQKDKSYGSFTIDNTITGVKLENGYVIFTVPENFMAGNILIGVHSDAECSQGSCLWSWHIWVNDQVEDVYLGNLHNSVPKVSILNMNMGSLQTKENLAGYAGVNSGLYYQFGRKDPFPPYNGADVKLPDVYTKDANLDNTDQKRVSEATSAAYPTQFVTGNKTTDQVRTWCTNATRDHWGAPPTKTAPGTVTDIEHVKTCFDPCPPGYHVITAFTWKSISYNESLTPATFENRLKMEYPLSTDYMKSTRGNDAVFPFDGCRTPGTAVKTTGGDYSIAGNLTDGGTAPYYWTASYYDNGSMNGNVVKLKSVTLPPTEGAENEEWTIPANTGQTKSFACSVRAQKQ